MLSVSLLLPLAGPHFVAVNNKNEIVVTDFHNHSVKVRAVRVFRKASNLEEHISADRQANVTFIQSTTSVI